jgi:hypothetical protein
MKNDCCLGEWKMIWWLVSLEDVPGQVWVYMGCLGFSLVLYLVPRPASPVSIEPAHSSHTPCYRRPEKPSRYAISFDFLLFYSSISCHDTNPHILSHFNSLMILTCPISWFFFLGKDFLIFYFDINGDFLITRARSIHVTSIKRPWIIPLSGG